MLDCFELVDLESKDLKNGRRFLLLFLFFIVRSLPDRFFPLSEQSDSLSESEWRWMSFCNGRTTI